MKEKILALHKAGKSYRQIVKELGCSKGTVAYHLGLGQKEKALNRTKQKRNKIDHYIRMYKQGRKCADCKEDYPYWILEYDHLPGSVKLFTVCAYRHYTTSIEVVKAEIAKCEVVCSNCHANRTHMRKRINMDESLDVSSYYG